MRLHLLRHARPLIDPTICYGRSDVAVAGAETERLVRAVAATLPIGATLVSSPSRRCADLATALVQAAAYRLVRFDARLLELDFGAWEMRPWACIARDEIDAWAAAPVTWRPGGGENVLQMAQRIREFYDATKLQTGDCVVVCHAGTIRLLQACRMHCALADIAAAAVARSYRPGFGELVVLDQG